MLASYDAVVGTRKEAHDEDDGGLHSGCLDVLPSVNGQLISLRRARAVK